MKRFAVAAVLAVVVLAATTAGGAGLTGAAGLAAVYDSILAARFEEADRGLKAACPPAPSETCQSLRAVSLWWQILLNPNSRALDERFERTVEAAVAAADAWTRREPDRAEAWFYFAGARAPRVQWQILRGDRLAAAREGNRIRAALERTLALDPTIEDAHFGIGLYRYYADVAPAALRWLRWLLLLPGGDREDGLRRMLRARERGQLLKGEADYQLHFIFLWYEHEPARALELLRGLDAQYPTNPLFLQRIADVQHDYLRDDASSAATWRALLGRAAARDVNASDLAAAQARLGLADRLIDLGEPAQALDILAPLLATKTIALYSARAAAHYTAARAHDRLAQRASAIDHYNAAIAAAPDDDPDRIRERARAEIRRNF